MTVAHSIESHPLPQQGSETSYRIDEDGVSGLLRCGISARLTAALGLGCVKTRWSAGPAQIDFSREAATGDGNLSRGLVELVGKDSSVLG